MVVVCRHPHFLPLGWFAEGSLLPMIAFTTLRHGASSLNLNHQKNSALKGACFLF